MIVPRQKLIYWTGIVMLPLSLMAAFDPSMTTQALIIAGAFLLLAALDATLALGSLDGVRAALPRIVRLTKDREGQIEIEIENDREGAKRLRLGLSLPDEMHSSSLDMAVVLPEGSRSSRVFWPLTALVRGNFFLENVYLETASPMGFWDLRKTSAGRTEVRVYPNIMGEHQSLAALFLNRGMAGIHSQRQVGKGREFEKLREYVHGDSYEDVHWKATAKRGRPITKIFQIERTQELYVIIDASRLSSRRVEMRRPGDPEKPGATEVAQLERFIVAAMVMGLAAERQGDRFGVLAFSDQVNKFIRAKNGKAHYSSCRDALYGLFPRMTNPDFGEVSAFIRQRLRRRALLIFLTNLDDPVLAESFVHNLDVLSRHHLVLVNMLAAPGVAPIFSSPQVANVDDIYTRLGGHIQWQKLQELTKVMKRRGVSMNLLDNEMMCPQLVSQYISIKRRQLI